MIRIVFIIIVYSLSFELFAQSNSDFSNRIEHHPQWEDVNFTPFAKGKFHYIEQGIITENCSAQSRTTANKLLTKLKKLSTTLVSITYFNQPQGVDIRFYSHANCNGVLDLTPKSVYAQAEITFNALYLAEEDNNQVIQSHLTNSSSVQMDLNNGKCLANPSLLISGNIYMEPCLIDTLNGCRVYEYSPDGPRFLLISKSKEKIYLPVSEEEYLRSKIESYEEKMNELLTKKKTEGSDLSYAQQYLNEKQQRKTDFETAYNELLKADKQAAAEFKKAYEATELQIEEEIKSNPDMKAHQGDEYNGQIDSYLNIIGKLKIELQNLSEKEKKSQAWYTSDIDESSVLGMYTGLARAGAPDARALVKINPAIIDQKKDPSVIQLITIQFNGLPQNSNEKYGYYIEGQYLHKVKNDKKIMEEISAMVGS